MPAKYLSATSGNGASCLRKRSILATPSIMLNRPNTAKAQIPQEIMYCRIRYRSMVLIGRRSRILCRVLIIHEP